MKRRDFLRFLLSTPLAAAVDVEKLLWVPGEKTIFIPTQAQMDFFYGIPYHETNGSTGQWLGLSREDIRNAKLIGPGWHYIGKEREWD